MQLISCLIGSRVTIERHKSYRKMTRKGIFANRPSMFSHTLPKKVALAGIIVLKLVQLGWLIFACVFLAIHNGGSFVFSQWMQLISCWIGTRVAIERHKSCRKMTRKGIFANGPSVFSHTLPKKVAVAGIIVLKLVQLGLELSQVNWVGPQRH